jgi:large subunit ribosomal protein L25
MAIISLKAKSRLATGKGAARQARMAGKIPGVLYGPGEEAVVLEVDVPDFLKVHQGGHGENVLMDLTVDSAEPQKVLFREVQRDPVTEQVLHIDFYHVSLTKLIRVHVPVHLEGIPDGVKNSGGILQHVMREVEVECLPTDIPDNIKVDVSELGIHDAIHISDLPTGKFQLMDDMARTVASVIPPVVSKEATAEDEAEAVEGEEGAEPERVGGKDEKEGAEKADEKADDKSKGEAKS